MIIQVGINVASKRMENRINSVAVNVITRNICRKISMENKIFFRVQDSSVRWC